MSSAWWGRRSTTREFNSISNSNEISEGSTPTSTGAFFDRLTDRVRKSANNTETKTVQIVATSAEHAVFFDRLGTNGSQKNSAKVTGCILYNRISVQRRAKVRYSN